MGRIELPTSPLPRGCSTTEPHGHCLQNSQPYASGAGEGNRTLVLSLEGFSSTIELHPRHPASAATAFNLVEGEGFEPSKAEPSDLQSDPFDRSGTPPEEGPDYPGVDNQCQQIVRACERRCCADAPDGHLPGGELSFDPCQYASNHISPIIPAFSIDSF